ncbi:hypothetical protein, partial [Serratia marcescens]|uniref:hypothetical protein n=1 Tax=Serratia marcescens TaxID=615 RepID=UPI00281443D9
AQKEANWRGTLSASPVGSAFAGGFNGLTAGFSDELAGGVNALTGGSYTEGRDAFNAKKQLLSAANPISDTLGNIGGGALAMSLPGAGLT